MPLKPTSASRQITVTFSYGKERIGVTVFSSAAAAQAWASEPATREMYPSARAGGGFVIWGTDQEKVASYLARIGDVADPPLEGPVSTPPWWADPAAGAGCGRCRPAWRPC